MTIVDLLVVDMQKDAQIVPSTHRIVFYIIQPSFR